MTTEKKKQLITTVLYAACIAAIVFVVFKYALPILMPFLVAFVVTALLTPLVNLLHEKAHLPKKPTAIVCVTAAYLLLAGLILLIGMGGYRWIMNADGWFQTQFVPTVQLVYTRLTELLDRVGTDFIPYLSSAKDTLISTIGSKISTLSAEVLSGAAGWLPGFLIRIIFAIVATYFMATDVDRILHFFGSRMEESTYRKIHSGWTTIRTTFGRYIRAYSLIFVIMFLMLTLGFFIARIENFVLIALLVAVFDILPILGSSMVLLPWSIILLITGDYQRGAIMFAVYVVVVVVRQFIEPKIVGEHVGLHPLITLIAMYVGSKLFGGVGLFGFPICCAVIVQLEHAGVLNLFPKKRDVPDLPDPPKKWYQNIFSKKTK